MKAVLIKKKFITDKDTLYIFDCPMISKASKPGQFVEVKLPGEFFLRRPISIFDADEKDGLSLLVRTVGKGSEYMLSLKEGDELDILGPLGNGFSIDRSGQRCLLAGGGIGIAPLYMLAKSLRAEGKDVRLFFSPKRDAKVLDAISDFDAVVAENRLDIKEKLPALLDGVDTVFACGPEGLLETLAKECIKRDVPCQLSMERRMGCGIDLCKGCVVAVRTENGIEYKECCKDGPVFDAKEVAFHEKP